jgi:hypothetical protein
MEILINELSLNGQFAATEDALIPFIALLKEFDSSKDVLFKKQDFWQSQITSTIKLYDVLVQPSDLSTRFKSQLGKLVDDPYWETARKHDIKDSYEYNGKNINDSSLAESCERDKFVVSFLHVDFSNTKLTIIKNASSQIEVDNLFEKPHYVEVSYNRGFLSKCEYFEKKFTLGLITLLQNEYRFSKTKINVQGQSVYKESSTNKYWYLDNLHGDHYEIFNANREHIGEADLQGNIDVAKKVAGRTITL